MFNIFYLDLAGILKDVPAQFGSVGDHLKFSDQSKSNEQPERKQRPLSEIWGDQTESSSKNTGFNLNYENLFNPLTDSKTSTLWCPPSSKNDTPRDDAWLTGNSSFLAGFSASGDALTQKANRPHSSTDWTNQSHLVGSLSQAWSNGADNQWSLQKNAHLQNDHPNSHGDISLHHKATVKNDSSWSNPKVDVFQQLAAQLGSAAEKEKLNKQQQPPLPNTYSPYGQVDDSRISVKIIF